MENCVQEHGVLSISLGTWYDAQTEAEDRV